MLSNALWPPNCLEMRKAIKCSQCYRALCSCRCSRVYINKFAMSVCLSVCLSGFPYVFGRASTYGAETWQGGRVWRSGGNCQLFVATRHVKGHLEVNLFRNALRPPNLVTMIVEGPLDHCHGQRSCRGHLGSTRG